MKVNDEWDLQAYLSSWREEQTESQARTLDEIKMLSVRATKMEQRVDTIEAFHNTIRNGGKWLFTTLFVTILGGLVTFIVGIFKPHP